MLQFNQYTNVAGCSSKSVCCCVRLQILMTGEVAGLFPKEELDVIVNDMRPIMKAEAPGKAPHFASLQSTARFSQALLCPWLLQQHGSCAAALEDAFVSAPCCALGITGR